MDVASLKSGVRGMRDRKREYSLQIEKKKSTKINIISAFTASTGDSFLCAWNICGLHVRAYFNMGFSLVLLLLDEHKGCEVQLFFF